MFSKQTSIATALVLAAVATVAMSSQAEAQWSSRNAGMYRHGAVTLSPSMVRTPFGVARAGSSYAAPSPALVGGSRYGAAKFAPGAIRIPAGVMGGTCRRVGAGIIC